MSKSIQNLNRQLMDMNPTAMIELFEIDFSYLQPNFEMLKDLYGMTVNDDSVYRFCSMINGSNPIIWQGKSYQPLPIEIQGYEKKSDGRLPRPRLLIANPEGVLSRIVHSNFDFANCKITRKTTYLKFLDQENFQGGINPFGQSDPASHFDDDIYYINKKVQENQKVIEFELVSALEMQDSIVPARTILSGYCSFTYRCSVGCNYQGLPIETADGKSLIKDFAKRKEKIDGVYYTGAVNWKRYNGTINQVPKWSKYGNEGDKNNIKGYNLGDVVKIIPRNSNNPYKSTPHVFVCIQTHEEPSKNYPFFSPDYWMKDECSKTLQACKKRFSLKYDPDNKIDLYKYNQSINSKGLRFGGFPGTRAYPIE